ncbi:MAG: sialidase, partial [Gemmatimonadetes bacterium]|nr:sialidase [Gemmatimonadota bacterium]
MHLRRLSVSTLAIAGVVLVSAMPGMAQPAPMPSSSLAAGATDALRYRHVGPVGNRVSAVAGVPGDANVYWVGAASGGIWKSVDGGHSWRSVFDDHGVQSIGALAVAPSDPDVVWAGTGEPFIRSNVSHGAGVFRSDDGGESWRLVGLERTGRVARVIVHPEDPNTAWVAALGHLYGPQEERGVFRTRDGGATWDRVLFTDDRTGASDLWMDPSDPDHLIAGMWTMHIRTWGRWSGGPGSGLFETRDGGTTWARIEGRGLPEGTVGKVGLAGTPADPNRIYALIETDVNVAVDDLDYEHEGVVWRSDDGGATWDMVNADHTLVQRPHYYNRAAVATDDPDEVHFLATRHSVSVDGALSTRRGNAGGDNHDMWIDPLLPDRMIVGHDQGISISTNRGRSWHRPLLPIAQMYHVTVDTRVPYYVYGNRQDGPSTHGPSNTLAGGSIPIGAWRSVGGCESGWSVPDTVSNDVVWSGCYEGILDRHTMSNAHSRTVSVWPDNPEGWPADELRYRFQWTFPIAVSPHDPETVYTGSQYVHRTRDGGANWEVISPDLSTGLDSILQKTGGLTPDDASPTYAGVLFALVESPLAPGELWAGTNDGLLHLSRDGGRSWTDLSARLPGLPALSTISSIEPSRHVAGTAYVAVDGHQIGDFRPLLWKTTDWGESWT